MIRAASNKMSNEIGGQMRRGGRRARGTKDVRSDAATQIQYIQVVGGAGAAGSVESQLGRVG
jgi:hypothetical protein